MVEKIKEIERVFDESITLAPNAMLLARPELFYEWDFEKNDGLDVYAVTKGSEKITWWICPKCSSNYDMNIYSRIARKGNCPYCAGRRVNHTNSLAVLLPSLAMEWHQSKNNELTPHDVTKSSNKKVWWMCPQCKSEYDMTVNDRTNASKRSSCPFCVGMRVNSTNSLSTLNPTLCLEWHPTKNSITSDSVTLGSKKKIWWHCNKCKSSWIARVSSRALMKSGCPFCEGIKVNETNCLLNRYPNISIEWNKSKNGKNTPSKTHCHSGKKAWWVCSICCSEYNSTVYHRTVRKQNCPYCVGRAVNSTNSLATLFPHLINQWHPSKNGNFTPFNVTAGNDKLIWWLGECGHEWEAPCYDRTRLNTGCPICSNHQVKKGFNDMWTTNPEQAKMLLNPEDGYKYTRSSYVILDWKCRDCNTVIKNKRISTVNSYGISCPSCSDGISFGEKFIYNMLTESNIMFDFDRKRKWSQGKRYDFYLPDYNWIIEVHGLQHYKDSFSRINGARDLKEEQRNDYIKEKIAIENGIIKYIVIDASHSSLDWIKDSILNSDLIDILKNIDFGKVYQLSQKSNVKIACDIWNSGIKSVPEISRIININSSTTRGYLKKGVLLGWCDYCPQEASSKSGSMAGKRSSKAVAQLYKTDVVANYWSSAAEAERNTGINNTSISFVCRNKRKSAGGFKWMYKEDYDNMLQEGISHEEYMNKHYPNTK